LPFTEEDEITNDLAFLHLLSFDHRRALINTGGLV